MRNAGLAVATLLMLLIAGLFLPVASHAIVSQIDGDVTSSGWSGYIDPFSGSFSLTFDDSVVTGVGLESFELSLDTLSLTIATTTYDPSEAGALLRYWGGIPYSFTVGGLVTGITGMVSGTNDFAFSYDYTGLDGVFELDYVGVEVAGVGGYGHYSETGTVTTTPPIPEPTTGLLLMTGMLGLAVWRRRQVR